MTDLHNHSLPEMDDGAGNMEMTEALLMQCLEQGIGNLALTSHYNCETESGESFLHRRARAFRKMKDHLAVQMDGMQIRLGAEVYFSPKLVREDVRKLCLEGTELLLLELPTEHRPQFLKEVLYEIQSQGVIPLIAHVERYFYVMENPAILAEWLESGIYAQLNAGSLLRRSANSRMIDKLMKWGLIQVISSDAHSPQRRPVKLRDAFLLIEKNYGRECADSLQINAEKLFFGGEPEGGEYHNPKYFLGRWR